MRRVLMTLETLIAMRRLILHVLLVTVFAVSLGAAQLNLEPHSAVSSSLADRWLEPQTILMFALALMVMGEIRGDIKRLKSRMEDLTDEKLATRFMPRELIEEKLRHLEQPRQSAS